MIGIGWLYLLGAIMFEVAATLGLRMAVAGSRLWYAAVGAGYVVAFVLLSMTLADGIPLGVAYGAWAATGVVLTAVLSRILFNEPLTWVMALGIMCVVSGVLLVELGSTP